jgi:CBS domain-containing membrane protein
MTKKPPRTPLLVRDWMSRPAMTLGPDRNVLMAKEIMDWGNVRHIPVVDGAGAVVGLVSQRDVLHASLSSVEAIPEAARNISLCSIDVRKVMRSPVRTISPDAPVREAARIMRRQKLGCLPVVDHGKLVGIISEHDLLRLIEEL